MGHKEVEAGTNEIQEKSTYSVISFGHSLPENYKGVVYAKWMQSLRYGNQFFYLADSKSYYEAYQKYIDMLRARPKSLLRIACLTDDVDVVLGWSLIEDHTLHYVYVVKEQRRLGIAKSLVPTEIKQISHLTKIGMTIWNNKLKSAKFNPFA